MTDEQLMSLVKAGQLNHLNEVFNRYSKRIYNYFLNSTLAQSDSDDLTQELFIRVMKYRNSYKKGRSVEFWIFQIARNMVKDHFRKLKIHKDQFSPVEVMPEMREEDTTEQEEREERLLLAMKDLADEKRELLVLSKFQGMKYEQIAKMRNTTVSNIKVQVHRTIKELKDSYFKVATDQKLA